MKAEHDTLSKLRDALSQGATACVVATGCPENRIDAARQQRILRRAGWAVVDDFREADVVLFASCGLTKVSEDLSMRIIDEILRAKKPGAQVVVCGCLPSINPRRLRESFNGPTFGSDECGKLAEALDPAVDSSSLFANHLVPRTDLGCEQRTTIGRLKNLLDPMRRERRMTNSLRRRIKEEVNVYGPNTFCIKVSTGCLSACSFCAVRLSRGKLRSKPEDLIVEEFRRGLAKGYDTFGLLGTDVGSYGRDNGTTLVPLLDRLLGESDTCRIKLRNIHPKYLIEMLSDLRGILHGGRIPYLNSPVQSGSDRILRLMRRGYESEAYLEAIRAVKGDFPGIDIRTQVMVGFPGETQEDFEASLSLVDEGLFDYVEVYRYQPRPGTEASGLEGAVPPRVTEERAHRMTMTALRHTAARRADACDG